MWSKKFFKGQNLTFSRFNGARKRKFLVKKLEFGGMFFV